jgi:hypothetical protein
VKPHRCAVCRVATGRFQGLGFRVEGEGGGAHLVKPQRCAVCRVATGSSRENTMMSMIPALRP